MASWMRVPSSLASLGREPQGDPRMLAAIARMRGGNRAVAEAWVEYARGLTEERPAISERLEKWFANEWGLVDPVRGYTWDETGRSMERRTPGRRGYTGAEQPAELRRAQRERAMLTEEWQDATYSTLYGLRVSARDPAGMTAGEVNRELDKLDAASSKNCDAFVTAGRGHERPSDYARKMDPLSLEANSIADRRASLRSEIERRYGPGAPRRLPRGFGPTRGRR